MLNPTYKIKEILVNKTHALNNLLISVSMEKSQLIYPLFVFDSLDRLNRTRIEMKLFKLVFEILELDEK